MLEAGINKFIEEDRIVNAYEIWVLSCESNLAAITMYQKSGFQRRNADDVMLSLLIR